MIGSRRLTRSVTPVVALALLAAVAASGLPAGAAARHPRPERPLSPSFQGEESGLRDFDRRVGTLAPTTAQVAIADALGATVRWNEFGTPRSLIVPGGFLGSGLPAAPVAAAKTWLRAHASLFRTTAAAVGELEVVRVSPVGRGSVVLLRQSFGGLPAAAGGRIAVGVLDGKVAYVSSSLAHGDLTGTPRISAADALRRAAANVGHSIDDRDISIVGRVGGWTRIAVEGFSHQQSARLVALPTPRQGAVPAYQTFVIDNHAGPLAFVHYIDARSGEVIVRVNAVDYAGEPKWDLFPAYPPLSYSSNDTRETWCWVPAPGCDRLIAQDPSATPLAWDVNPINNKPSQTSVGNNALGVEKWNSNDSFKVGRTTSTKRPGRDYRYDWTNQWLEQRCDPAVFESARHNDIDAAIANLFAGHNRMHDWAYRLGFTETAWNGQEDNFGRGEDDRDPENGNAQAGGIVGGPPGFQSRDNANQITPPDGQPPVTNMYLWQPIAGGFYAPCVDGDYDMSVIGHEYGHMISNRMVAGPDDRLRGLQANAMGESWSDLVAMEILNEYGSVPVGGESPFAIGAYVTQDPVAGIRNYNMSDSPLNYSDVGYDLVGPQVHADGEIWSATNFDIRSAMNARYGAGNAALQVECADGRLPADRCPGNRRWVQIVFDAWLLMGIGGVSMVDARDAMLAADVMRFGGANQDLLWNTFARRGLGENASSSGANDGDPVPSFESPFRDEATVRFHPVGPDGGPTEAELFVGRYEARSTPIADTDPGTALGDTFRIVPGTFELLARADGFGTTRITESFDPGEIRDLPVQVVSNLASIHNGATATGDGRNLDKLIDDTEETNWASLNAPVQGRQVTVRLDPSKSSHMIDRIQVSALLRPADPTDAGGDTGGQSRFSALRRFRILVCEASGGIDCSKDSQFRALFTSAADAFPARVPRPRAPDLIMRSFDIPRAAASHVRIVVLENQCTGTPGYRGDQDDDARNVTDCVDGSAQDLFVRIAEFQVFAR